MASIFQGVIHQFSRTMQVFLQKTEKEKTLRKDDKEFEKQVEFPVALAMRYGSMTIKKGLQELVDKGCDEVFLVPLYPQFAMATTETILVLAEEIRQAHFPNLKIESLKPFYRVVTGYLCFELA